MEHKEFRMTDAALDTPEKPVPKKRRSRLLIALTFLALAAIGVVAGILLTREAQSPYPVFHKVSSTKFSKIPEEPEKGEDIFVTISTPDYERYGVSFVAEVLRVFPDGYLGVSNVIYEIGERGYIAELLVKEVIVGDHIPQVVYISLSKEQVKEFREGQTVVYSGYQHGLEGAALVNARTGRIESFGVMFGGGYYSCSMSVFTDKDDPGIASAKLRIRGKASSDPKYLGYRTVLSVASAEGELRRALTEIASPEIGQFSMIRCFGGEVNHSYECYRYIDGYKTDEKITINIETGEVTYSDARYTAEDRDKLPDLKKLARKINTRKLEKPELLRDDNYKIEFYKFQGSYRKVNGEIYGLLGVCWSYKNQDPEKGETVQNSCYPKSYKIYTPDGECIDATDKTLNSVLGITE